MPLAGFEPAIPIGERPQTYVLDRSATGMGKNDCYWTKWHIEIKAISDFQID